MCRAAAGTRCNGPTTAEQEDRGALTGPQRGHQAVGMWRQVSAAMAFDVAQCPRQMLAAPQRAVDHQQVTTFGEHVNVEHGSPRQ